MRISPQSKVRVLLILAQITALAQVACNLGIRLVDKGARNYESMD